MNMDKTVLSIVVSTYNMKAYVSECIYSIIKQLNDRCELIIVNDGSTDGSDEICRDIISGRNEKVQIINQENKGQFYARHSGIENSNGEYIWCVDADDYITDDACKIIIDSLSANNKPDVLVIDYIKILKNGDLRYDRRGKYAGRYGREEFIKLILNDSTLNPLWRKVFKKDLYYKELDYDAFDKRQRGGDLIMSFQVINHAITYLFVDEVAYGYRINPQGISYNHNLNNEVNNYNTNQVLNRYLKKMGLFTGEILALYYRWECFDLRLRVLEVFRHTKSYRMAVKHWKAIRKRNWVNGILDKRPTRNPFALNLFMELFKYKLWVLLFAYCRLYKVRLERKAII